MADMYILSPDEELLTVLSSDGQDTCTFWDAKYKEELNKGSSFSFIADAAHPDARFLYEENQVIFKDKDGVLRLFVIKEIDDTDEDAEVNTLVTCEVAMMELAETFVKDFRPKDKTAQFVLDNVLARSRWVAEVTAELGTNSTTFYKKSALDCIAEVINIWGGELRDSIEFDGNKITKRIIKIVPRRGKDGGKRFEIDKDTENIRRTVISYPVTALWGYGASIPSTDEDGEETGGYSRFIDFSEVEWKKSKGDPVDKPLGQEWVGDPDLLKQLGRLKDGVLIHREGEYNNEDITEPEDLLKATYEHLITTASKTEVNYELSVQLLQNVPGYEHEHVELGDTTIAIDRNFAIPIETSQRVISMEYDITDPDNTCVVEIGQFLSALQKDTRLDQIKSIIDKNRGTWDSGGNPIVTDGSFPDKKPPVPSNVVVKANFQNVALTWDYNPSSYIAAYEIYASQMNDFTPSIENRIFRGKTGGYEHFTGVNEVWYYRLRSINTQGTASEYTKQFSATTQRVLTDDIMYGAVTTERLADLTITADKLSMTLSGQNILPGSILRNLDEIWRLNSSNRTLDTSKDFNEMRVVKGSDTKAVYGITFSGRNGLKLTKGNTYTLSFELKRTNSPGFNYTRIREGNKEVFAIPNTLTNLTDPSDQFVRYDLVFTPNVTISNGCLWLGDSTINVTDTAEFTIRKIQIREGDVRKEFALSPYDTQLIDGAITSALVAEAAIGTAAIQNAAIAKAHLKEAIIDNVHIIDGSITTAKIKDLSADKITSGTIQAIDIVGSLIRGARIEPLKESSAYDSYIESNMIYQRYNYLNQWYDRRYRELKISDGKIDILVGRRDSSDTDIPMRNLTLKDGSILLTGDKTNTTDGGAASIEIYCNDFDLKESGGVTDPSAYFRMKMNNKDVFNITTKLNTDSTGFLQINSTGAADTSWWSDGFFLNAKKLVHINADGGYYLNGPSMKLPMNTSIACGNEYKLPKKAAALEVVAGGLQTNGVIRLENVSLTYRTDATSTTLVTYNYMFPSSTVENIFTVHVQPYGSYSDAVICGVQNITSSGFKIYMRGSGFSKGIAGKTIQARLLIVYEVK
ncbi:phage tail spike protein [Bacillus atrophaeus]|uniref:phage tail spike protein n=1 Tax=Bacillus atrophaeus TaxID=1452 RepID=UPI002DBA229D|nr:phage tail spike protein [Bacillus atrophaeus]MEC0765098.1 phage tail spike protein [Bacillus atrophaeus]MEC0778231.1 phage tail spike protein [Bacillus atrophaeus]MEC0808267.1 phage tail spike protein [Bacillus atrophaeus]